MIVKDDGFTAAAFYVVEWHSGWNGGICALVTHRDREINRKQTEIDIWRYTEALFVISKSLHMEISQCCDAHRDNFAWNFGVIRDWTFRGYNIFSYGCLLWKNIEFLFAEWPVESAADHLYFSILLRFMRCYSLFQHALGKRRVHGCLDRLNTFTLYRREESMMPEKAHIDTRRICKPHNLIGSRIQITSELMASPFSDNCNEIRVCM